VTTSRFFVRPATRADVEALARARVELFRELGKLAAPEQAAFLGRCRDAYADLFDAGHGAAWLADDGTGDVAATLTVVFHVRLPTPALSAGLEGYVVGVWTRPAERGQGLGSALLRSAIETARRRGCARLRLAATDDGRRLYAAHGFRARDDAMELPL
jgi:GNAT superfamily N-acetyltransferase